MDISCPRCGGVAHPAGHEDGRAFFSCSRCRRVWATHAAMMTERPSSTGSAPRVLVADDSPQMLGLLTAWLEDEGCIVMTAGSGREALELARTCHPDIAFIDVVLPPPDGFEVCAMLTGRDGPAVVLMTGLSRAGSSRAAESGALSLLRKPFTREILIEALTRALAWRTARRGDASGSLGRRLP